MNLSLIANVYRGLQNNETVLCEIPGEKKCVVFALQHSGNDVTLKLCIVLHINCMYDMLYS